MKHFCMFVSPKWPRGLSLCSRGKIADGASVFQANEANKLVLFVSIGKQGATTPRTPLSQDRDSGNQSFIVPIGFPVCNVARGVAFAIIRASFQSGAGR